MPADRTGAAGPRRTRWSAASTVHPAPRVPNERSREDPERAPPVLRSHDRPACQTTQRPEGHRPAFENGAAIAGSTRQRQSRGGRCAWRLPLPRSGGIRREHVEIALSPPGPRWQNPLGLRTIQRRISSEQSSNRAAAHPLDCPRPCGHSFRQFVPARTWISRLPLATRRRRLGIARAALAVRRRQDVGTRSEFPVAPRRYTGRSDTRS
jgi:hypothetical protein